MLGWKAVKVYLKCFIQFNMSFVAE